MKKLWLVMAVLSGLIICLAGPASAITTWDAAADFSAVNNPTGQWSYGYSYPTITSGLNLYTIHFTDPSGLEFWNTGLPTLVPGVWKNPTSSDITLFNALTVPAGKLAFHPGVNDEFSHVVWTALVTGTYLINATFTGYDFVGPTSTDVHVYVNGVSQFNALINTYGGAGTSYSDQLPILAGQTVDFVVGWGSNGNYGNDTTGIAATITAIPLPPTALLLGSGLLGLGLLRRKWSLKS